MATNSFGRGLMGAYDTMRRDAGRNFNRMATMQQMRWQKDDRDIVADQRDLAEKQRKAHQAFLALSEADDPTIANDLLQELGVGAIKKRVKKVAEHPSKPPVEVSRFDVYDPEGNYIGSGGKDKILPRLRKMMNPNVLQAIQTQKAEQDRWQKSYDQNERQFNTTQDRLRDQHKDQMEWNKKKFKESKRQFDTQVAMTSRELAIEQGKWAAEQFEKNFMKPGDRDDLHGKFSTTWDDMKQEWVVDPALYAAHNQAALEFVKRTGRNEREAWGAIAELNEQLKPLIGTRRADGSVFTKRDYLERFDQEFSRLVGKGHGKAKGLGAANSERVLTGGSASSGSTPQGGLPASTPAGDTGYGKRADGTPKGGGYFGELKRPDGGISTELSIGVQIDGKETEIPLLVPTLTQNEVDHLLAGKEPTKGMVQKAVDHARFRINNGKSPFATGQDKVYKVGKGLGAGASSPEAEPRPEPKPEPKRRMRPEEIGVGLPTSQANLNKKVMEPIGRFIRDYGPTALPKLGIWDAVQKFREWSHGLYKDVPDEVIAQEIQRAQSSSQTMGLPGGR
jgi:hypothetical protein